MSTYNTIKALCSEIGCEYSNDVMLSARTSFKIGGKADLFVMPSDDDMLAAVISACKVNNVRTLILGKGSNLLVSDNGFRGVVISTEKLDEIKLIDETTIYCRSGASLSKLCRYALDNSLTGLEFAFGIPGTAGGAAYMNAGAYGGEMKDVLFRCDHICADGKKGFFEGDELDLSYRHSAYSKSDKTVTALYIKLEKGDKTAIKAKMDDLMGRRRDKQPLEYPSAGSTFKRPEGYFAGALIEQSGLKGFKVGGAQVSEKHAGFVVNVGGATAKDVIAVIDHCRKTVFADTGVILEPEVEITE